MIISKLNILLAIFLGLKIFNFQPQKSFVIHSKEEKPNQKFIAPYLTSAFHAYHTSLTEISYNAKEKSLEVSIRVFTDDFEAGLTKFNNNQKIIIDASPKTNALIDKYIQQHFALISPQKLRKNYTVLGKEIEGQATWIYIEVPDSQDIIGYSLQNSILTELFNDQTNLVNLTFASNKKTIIYNNKKTLSEISF